MRSTILVYLPIAVLMMMSGCSPTDPGGPAEHMICYEQSVDGSIDIISNNLDGTNPIRIAGNVLDEVHPAWSPDGSRIAFHRNGAIFVYDLDRKTETNITADGEQADGYPKWTADGNVYVAYSRPVANPKAVYLIKPDGSARTKVFDYQPGIARYTVYACTDSKTFFYVEGTKVYQTTIDGAARSFVFDLEPGSDKHFTVYDIDRARRELLVGTNAVNDSVYTLAVVIAATKEVKPLLAAERNFSFVSPRYSRDGRKIVFVEQGIDVEYISIYDGGMKQRIAECSRRAGETFGSSPLEFSWDNGHVAFTKRVYAAGSSSVWTDELYTVSVVGHEVNKIDKGFGAAWNPHP